MRPFDGVMLNEDLPDYGLKAGTSGAIVEEYQNGAAFTVEFLDDDGYTIDVVDVRAEQLTLVAADFQPGEQVALLIDLPEQRLRRGPGGIVPRRSAPRVYEVEFADTAGNITLRAEQLMLLYRQPIEAQSSA